MAFPFGACSFVEGCAPTTLPVSRMLRCRHPQRKGGNKNRLRGRRPYRLASCRTELPALAPVAGRSSDSNSLTFAATLTCQRSSRQNAMEEKRKHPRTEINEPAYVSSGGSVMTCIVRNISAEGAAIDVENPAFVPPHF